MKRGFFEHSISTSAHSRQLMFSSRTHSPMKNKTSKLRTTTPSCTRRNIVAVVLVSSFFSSVGASKILFLVPVKALQICMSRDVDVCLIKNLLLLLLMHKKERLFTCWIVVVVARFFWLLREIYYTYMLLCCLLSSIEGVAALLLGLGWTMSAQAADCSRKQEEDIFFLVCCWLLVDHPCY